MWLRFGIKGAFWGAGVGLVMSFAASVQNPTWPAVATAIVMIFTSAVGVIAGIETAEIVRILRAEDLAKWEEIRDGTQHQGRRFARVPERSHERARVD